MLDPSPPTKSDPTISREAAAVARLEKLQSVADAALAHLTLDDLLDEVLLRVRSALEADTCAVLLLDEASGELVARAAKGLEEEVERGVRIPLGKGFAGRVAAERRIVAIPELAKADVVNPILREKGIRSMLGAPLLARERVLGVVHVGSLTPRDFTADDAELLELAAQRVAMGLERAFVHDELVRLEQLERNFIALASHELRTPAAVVYGVAATLWARRDDLGPEQVEALTRALFENSERLRLLVDQLLDLSRVDSAALRVTPRRLRLRAFTEHVVAGLPPEDKEAIEIEIQPDATLWADPDALERILTNLLLNAIRYGRPPVTIHCEQGSSLYRLIVEDRGDGVPAEFVPKLFERFQRGRSTDERASGAGLGLAIALSYTRAHGGAIEYEDASPHGARFVVVLPRDGEGGAPAAPNPVAASAR